MRDNTGLFVSYPVCLVLSDARVRRAVKNDGAELSIAFPLLSFSDLEYRRTSRPSNAFADARDTGLKWVRKAFGMPRSYNFSAVSSEPIDGQHSLSVLLFFLCPADFFSL